MDRAMRTLSPARAALTGRRLFEAMEFSKMIISRAGLVRPDLEKA
jgi:hypothetical protein